jgi:hypothetical protein
VAGAQLQALAAETEWRLTAQAQWQVRLERELVELRALVMDCSTGCGTMGQCQARIYSALVAM